MSVQSLTSVSGLVIASHNDLADLGSPNDDHTQYFLLAGRAGGQIAAGDTAGGGQLILRGDATALDRGDVVVEGCLIVDDPWDNNPNSTTAVSVTGDHDTGAAGFVQQAFGHGIGASSTYGVQTTVFIFSAVRDQAVFNQQAAIALSTFILFLAQSVLEGTSGFAPMGPICFADQILIRPENGQGAVPNAGFHVSFQATPQLRAESAGDSIRRNATTGHTFTPAHITNNATASIDHGVVVGYRSSNPAPPLFGQNIGLNAMDSYVGFQCDNIPFGGAVSKTCFEGSLVDGANNRFLDNPGGCRSDFGGGNLLDCGFVQCLADNVGLSLGAAGGDQIISWNGSALEFDPLVGDELLIESRVGGHSLRSSDPTGELRIDYDKMVWGSNSVIGNGNIRWDHPGDTITVAGEYVQDNIAQTGTVDANGNAMSRMAVRRTSPMSISLSGGSVIEVSTGEDEGMTTSGLGGGETQARRITGRLRQRGAVQWEPRSAGNLSGTVANWTGLLTNAQSNTARKLNYFTCDAGAVLAGIDDAVTQDGDSYILVNNGSNALTVNDNDAANEPVATQRIFTTTGVNLTIPVNGALLIWRDLTTVPNRWRASQM